MNHTFHINDISNPKAKAFLEFIKTLDFISLDENRLNSIPQWHKDVVLARQKTDKKDYLPLSTLDNEIILGNDEAKF